MDRSAEAVARLAAPERPDSGRRYSISPAGVGAPVLTAQATAAGTVEGMPAGMVAAETVATVATEWRARGT